MLKSRAEYKNISRWVIRNQKRLQAVRMAGLLAGDRSRDLWSETKRIRGSRLVHPNVVDCVVGDDEVCEVFYNRYCELYQSVPTDQGELNRIFDTLSEGVSQSCCRGTCYSDHLISVADLQGAIKKLKTGKADVDSRLSSDSFIYACDGLLTHLSLFLNALLRHPDAGVVLSKSVLVPIPKSTKKSLNQSDNYRSIAISSIVGKCLDNIILMKHDTILRSDDLHFGFKRNHSTTQCTYVLNEVVDHYLRGGSRVHVVLLDASRAFDRVHYGRLFSLLIDRKMCYAYAKLLLSMYTSQSLTVRWMNGISGSFECKNGVKQGGVLSPILFSIIIDVLLQRLRACGVGCYLGHVFSGAVSYADDVSLMAPSISGAQKMLDECSKFAREFHLLFNCSKSQLLVFGSSHPSTRQLILNDAPIPLVSFATRLGHVIGEGAPQRNLEKTICDLTIRANMLSRNYSFVHFDHL